MSRNNLTQRLFHGAQDVFVSCSRGIFGAHFPEMTANFMRLEQVSGCPNSFELIRITCLATFNVTIILVSHLLIDMSFTASNVFSYSFFSIRKPPPA